METRVEVFWQGMEARRKIVAFLKASVSSVPTGKTPLFPKGGVNTGLRSENE